VNKPILYPWLTPVWQLLTRYHTQAHLPHAFLLSGISGLGKQALAEYFAYYLLCQNKAEAPCGVCKTCRLFQAETLPDYYQTSPEKVGKTIRIDQIRQLCQALTLTPQIAEYKVAIVCPAERMTNASANSLLKTLEEPTPNTVMLLVTDFPHRLLPTVRSRCQQVVIAAPEPAQALTWLQAEGVEHAETLLALTSGAPLAARNYASQDWLAKRATVFKDFLGILQHQTDVLALSQRWQKSYYPACLHWLMSWIIDMIRLKMVASPPDLANPDFIQGLQQGAKQQPVTVLFKRLDEVQRAIQQATGGISVNAQMLLDDVLYAWVK